MSPVSEFRPMIEMKIKYLIEDFDRHENSRLYVRVPGRKKVRIRAEPGTDAFWAEYRAAIAGAPPPGPARPEPIVPAAPETFGWLCERYLAESIEYKRLHASTQRIWRGHLEACKKEKIDPDYEERFSEFPLDRMDDSSVCVLRDRKAVDTPAAANNRLKALRSLFKWARKQKRPNGMPLVSTNPTIAVEKVDNPTDGFHTWTIDEVKQFAERHPPGTKAFLALALFLFTGQRRSDVVGFGRQHVKKKIEIDTVTKEEKTVPWLKFTQTKNRHRRPVHMELPLLPVLEHVISISPVDEMTFLVTAFGRPFTVAGFGNWFRDRCNEAGLAHCSAHGLRKAGACIAVENGASEFQLNAIFGWTGPQMASLYTRQARQKKIAEQSMHLLSWDRVVPLGNQNQNEKVPLQEGVEESGTIAGKTR